MTAAPKVDSRDAARVTAELMGLLRQALPNWPGPAVDTATRAMIHVFARYCEIIIDRLNRAPDKNLLAFLDLLGAEPLPPQPARAPVTFYLTASRQADVMVPRRTQIAAPPLPGGQEPIVFETEHELTVTSARLDSLFVKDGSLDRYADLRMALGVAESPAAPIFEGNQPIEHALLIGLGAAVAQPVNQLRIRFDLGAPAAQLLRCAWEWRSEKEWIVLTPESDGTKGLTQSGEIVFRNLSAIPETVIEGTREHYLRCRLMDPLTGAMPQINRLVVTVDLEKDGIPLDKAFFNATPVDISKDFYPFGENPRFGDVFFFSSTPAFSPPGARITLHLRMTNPASAGETSPVLPVGPRNTRLAWEYWDGNTWVELGVAEFGRPAPAAPSSFSDTSDTFSQDGEVTFQFGSPAQVAIVNGQPALWVRVRLIGGDYGRDVSYEADTARGYVVVPSTLRPPVIHSIVCGYRVSATFEPAVLIRRNDFRFERISPPFEPFQPAAETQPFVYLGFASPAPSFPARVLTLYFAVAPGHPETVVTDSISDRSALLWEYWDGSKWDAVAVRDDTRGLLRSGVVRFIVPRTLASRDEFDLRRFWFRVHRRETGAQFQPMIRRILLNTALASNTQTTLNEVLGSSNGTAGQMFQSARKPVLPDQKVQVLEPYSPGPDDLRRLRAEEGPDAIESPESGATGVAAGAVWVRWHEVPSFTGSSPRDRHYTVERDTGTLRFGDGVHGRIPFRVTNNIRMSYQTGGGVNGNVPALAISQLKTTVPYVDRAVNLERASGGADPEPLASLTERAPLMTRHNFRAVATEDFEDLARLASPEVARAKCVPNIDLRQDPEGRHPRTGVVSVILAPHSPDPMPMPDFELFDRVRGFLDDRRLATFDVVLAGPEYVRVDITAEIAVSDPSAASETEIAVEQAVVAFLHPVNGGRECHGWKFGQIPHQADLYSLIECMPGVEHVRSVQVAAVQEATGAVQRGRFLICAGVIRITASLD